MTAVTFDSSVFFPAFKAAGMLSIARVSSGGEAFDLDVDFSQPDDDRFGTRAISRDYAIEYQHADAPELAEGDLMMIDDAPYRVRQAPLVTGPGNAADGYYRTAILTEISDHVLKTEDGDIVLTAEGLPTLLEDA